MGLFNRKLKGALLVRKPVKLPATDPGLPLILALALRRRLADGLVGRFIRFAVERHPHIVGEHGPACFIHPTAHVGNAIINATSGIVRIGEYAFLSSGVSLLAGTHDPMKTGIERQQAIPGAGHDIIIDRGVWIAANTTVVGPCHIGANAVVGAGAVVLDDVPANAFVAGIPARVIKILDLPVENAPTSTKNQLGS